MIWSVDQDDMQYTALRGLYPDIDVNQPSSVESGDQCTITGCGQNCPSGWDTLTTLTTNPGSATSCTSSSPAKLCCPSGNAPTNCHWSGGGGSTCNPQVAITVEGYIYKLISLLTVCCGRDYARDRSGGRGWQADLCAGNQGVLLLNRPERPNWLPCNRSVGPNRGRTPLLTSVIGCGETTTACASGDTFLTFVRQGSEDNGSCEAENSDPNVINKQPCPEICSTNNKPVCCEASGESQQVGAYRTLSLFNP